MKKRLNHHKRLNKAEISRLIDDTQVGDKETIATTLVLKKSTIKKLLAVSWILTGSETISLTLATLIESKQTADTVNGAIEDRHKPGSGTVRITIDPDTFLGKKLFDKAVSNDSLISVRVLLWKKTLRRLQAIATFRSSQSYSMAAAQVIEQAYAVVRQDYFERSRPSTRSLIAFCSYTAGVDENFCAWPTGVPKRQS